MPAGAIADRVLQADDIAGVLDLYGVDAGRTRAASRDASPRAAAACTARTSSPSTCRRGELIAGYTLADDGTFAIAGLSPGPHVLRVEPLDDADVESFFAPARVDIDFARDLCVRRSSSSRAAAPRTGVVDRGAAAMRRGSAAAARGRRARGDRRPRRRRSRGRRPALRPGHLVLGAGRRLGRRRRRSGTRPRRDARQRARARPRRRPSRCSTPARGSTARPAADGTVDDGGHARLGGGGARRDAPSDAHDDDHRRCRGRRHLHRHRGRRRVRRRRLGAVSPGVGGAGLARRGRTCSPAADICASSTTTTRWSRPAPRAHAGAGARVWLAGGHGGGLEAGLTGDVRWVIRRDGITFDDGARSLPALSVRAFVGF